MRRVPQGQHINMDSKAQQEVSRRLSKTQEKEKGVERKQNTRVPSCLLYFIKAYKAEPKRQIFSRHPIID